MSDLLNFFKELFLIKQEDRKIVGLTSLKKAQKEIVKKAEKKKKEEKELKLSDLMRRRKPQNMQTSINCQTQTIQTNQIQPKNQGTIRPAVSSSYNQKTK